MKLNIGPGDHRAFPPWVNLDSRAIPTADVVGDAGALPFATGSAEAIYAGHIMEHIPLDAMPVVLDEWRRVLAPGGSMLVVGPDIDRCIQQHEPQFILESVIAHADPPAGHAWTCSSRVLEYLLRLHGWDVEPIDVATVHPPAWPIVSNAPWQLAILAAPA